MRSRRVTRPAGTSHNDLRAVGSAKTFVKVHDSEKRTQVGSPQQNYSVTSPGAPSGTICGVESRAAHGQVAPNTNGGTLNPVAFINPTTVNASGRVAFNSQVDGSDRNQGVFVVDSDGTISAIAIGCGGLGGEGDTTSMCGDASPIGGHFGGFFSVQPSHPTLMMRATYCSFAMSMAVIQDERCSFTRLLPGKLLK